MFIECMQSRLNATSYNSTKTIHVRKYMSTCRTSAQIHINVNLCAQQVEIASYILTVHNSCKHAQYTCTQLMQACSVHMYTTHASMLSTHVHNSCKHAQYTCTQRMQACSVHMYTTHASMLSIHVHNSCKHAIHACSIQLMQLQVEYTIHASMQYNSCNIIVTHSSMQVYMACTTHVGVR